MSISKGKDLDENLIEKTIKDLDPALSDPRMDDSYLAMDEIDKEVVEQLADIEHQRWASWQNYLHSYLTWGGVDWHLPHDKKEQWQRQIETPYSKLSEAEKESDREQVRRYLPIISKLLHQAERRAINQCWTIVRDLTQEFANTKVSDRGNGYDWLIKAQHKIEGLENKEHRQITKEIMDDLRPALEELGE